MPITKQAIKRVKQDAVKTARNKANKSRMRSLIKLVNDYVTKKDAKNAAKMLPEAIKSIDMAAKKNLIHKNNAARKKSALQKSLNALGGSAPKAAAKTEEKAEKKAPAKKAPAKKTAAKAEK